MIIDDDHRVAFVHIPKCGGTSVRRQLARIDSCHGFFYDRRDHQTLGALDYCHIPLVFLQRHFPVEFEKLAAYRSFALVRDPHTRFASATFERLALFGGVRRTAATARDALREAGRAIGWLEGRDTFCDPGYIHFARQVDFLALGGRRVVDAIYALDDMDGFAAELQSLTGIDLDPGRRENTNLASPSRLLAWLHRAKPIYSRLTTWDQREALLKALRRWRLRGPDALYEAFRRDTRISAFVESYYEADFAIHDAARARMAARRARPPDGTART
jgi:hypothetical protein